MFLLIPIQGIEQSKINDEIGCFSLLFKSAKIINIGITGFEIWNVKKG
jgi:hypothetical protein